VNKRFHQTLSNDSADIGKLFLLGVQTACANSFDPSANSFTLKKGIIA
jgi:hypothetical protein